MLAASEWGLEAFVEVICNTVNVICTLKKFSLCRGLVHTHTIATINHDKYWGHAISIAFVLSLSSSLLLTTYLEPLYSHFQFSTTIVTLSSRWTIITSLLPSLELSIHRHCYGFHQHKVTSSMPIATTLVLQFRTTQIYSSFVKT